MISHDEILDARILIVDDEEVNLLLMEQLLHEAGYRHITPTRDPYSVCGLHREHQYDLILLDLKMPNMDGFAVMAGLKEIEIEGYLPVLVMTAQPSLKVRALAAGAKDFISKPFNLMEARARIHNMLEVRLLYKQLEAYSRALESMAMHDALTGLPNRRLLMDRLALSIAHASRNKSSMAVMYLDLDGFKAVNDTSGHDTGDILLRLVADRLVAAVRQEDTVARMGGDEFVIVLWEINHPDGVEKLVSKIIEALSQPAPILDGGLRITASIGVSVYPIHGEHGEALMKRADQALYMAKQAGKNNYHIASSSDATFSTPYPPAKPGRAYPASTENGRMT